MHIITSDVGYENVTSLVDDYDSQLLLPSLVEFYKTIFFW
jgi:hypothetical protein